MPDMKTLTANGVTFEIKDPRLETEIAAAKAEATTQANQAKADAIADVKSAIVDESPEVGTVSGETVLISDYTESPLHGLKLFGKSTQDGTPTPEAPVEIVSAGADGDIGVKVCGANLLNIEDSVRTENGVTMTCSNGVITLSGTKESGWGGMAIKGNYEGTEDVCGLAPGTYRLSDDNVTIMIGRSDASYDYAGTGAPFTLGEGDFICYVYTNFNVGEALNKTLYPMINAGTTALPWEPYKGQTFTALTPNGLPGIKVSSGGNYTDSTGQQWVTDEVDFARGVYVQRCAKYVFDGALAPTSVTVNDYGIANIYFLHPFGVNMNYRMESICNRLSYQNTLISITSTEGYHISVSNAVYIRLDSARCSTVEEANAYLANNPIELLYVLETPIETPLTEEELAQFAALHTNNPTTTILNDSGAGMEASYYLPNEGFADYGGSIGDLHMRGKQVKWLGPPVDPTDAATKTYVDYAFSKCAPAGFGIGTAARNIDANDATGGGFIETGHDTPYLSSFSGFTTTFGDDHQHGVQELTDVLVYKNVKVRRYKLNGVWSEWEFENPPMELGVEYRTTERYMGKAVYTTLVDMGGLPNTTVKYYSHNISITQPLRCSAHIVGGDSIPAILNATSYSVTAYLSLEYVIVETKTDLSTTTARAQLWYTKD